MDKKKPIKQTYRNQFLEKARHVWTSPANGNAIVLLKQVLPSTAEAADLDSGDVYMVNLRQLKEKVREVEEADYEYSWTTDHDPEVFEQIERAACEKKLEEVEKKIRICLEEVWDDLSSETNLGRFEISSEVQLMIRAIVQDIK